MPSKLQQVVMMPTLV